MRCCPARQPLRPEPPDRGLPAILAPGDHRADVMALGGPARAELPWHPKLGLRSDELSELMREKDSLAFRRVGGETLRVREKGSEIALDTGGHGRAGRSRAGVGAPSAEWRATGVAVVLVPRR